VFRERVRARDRCCVVLGLDVEDEDFDTFHAAHIFPFAHLDLVRLPLAYPAPISPSASSASISHSPSVLLKYLIYVSSNSMSQWRSGQWSQMIEDDDPNIGQTKIHSIQNGLLLSSPVHTFFDKYKIAINPDVRVFPSAHKMILSILQNGYKVTCFTKDIWHCDGLYMILKNYPQQYQPLRALLKHHFRQAVLCNMKGRGPEYDWDEDLTPGTDPVAEISQSQEGKLRFELVMAERLNPILA
jgi:hypothetical protein